MGALGKRVLIVTGQKPIAQVAQKSGGSSTLYEVYATDPEGKVIEEPLRTFAELEEGVEIEYEISSYHHQQYGTSYTLTPPKRNSFKRLQVLEEQIELLTRWAETRGFDSAKVEGWVKKDRERKEKEERGEQGRREREAEVAAMEPIEAPENPELDEKFGKNAPWSDADLDLSPGADGADAEDVPND